MATKALGKRTLDARPDRPDMRDRLYAPPLKVLPPSHPPQEWIERYLPAYEKAGLILDQGEEGACTGFGLAALINYLEFRHAFEASGGNGKPKAQPIVSPRMLYHLARVYDEWPGEDYEGSSCRGAMKGWFHHGVCADSLWPYRKNGKVVFVPPKEGWTKDAAGRPLGAYYRITYDAIADMQAAIVEVGAVYASGDVHTGWDDPGRKPAAKAGGRKRAGAAPALKSVPTIDWKPGRKPNGGHAFALVGYDDEGFIVQNSWGPDWGFHGFARLTYADWLKNGSDAWVAAIGAPIAGEAPTIVLSSGRTVPVNAKELNRGLAGGITSRAIEEAAGEGVWSLDRAARHALVLANDGRLASPLILDAADAADAATRVTKTWPSQWLADPKNRSRKLVLYAHGGLNDLRSALARVKVLGPCFYDNDAYPIFACWQSGFADALKDALEDVISGVEDDPRLSQAQGAFADAKDRALEALAIPAGRPLWLQMKQNALAASDEYGGIRFLASRLAELAKDEAGLEVHLVGHSAGAIMIAPLLDLLRERKVKVGSLALYAPACTVDLANRYYAKHLGTTIPAGKVAIEILSDAREKDDCVGPYGKSLLYLVSRALENVHKTPILGLEAVFDPAFDKEDILASPPSPRGVAQTAQEARQPLPSVVAWRNAWAPYNGSLSVLDRRQVRDGEKAIPSAHGCFDNWTDCIRRTIERIRGSKLKKDLPPLVGF